MQSVCCLISNLTDIKEGRTYERIGTAKGGMCSSASRLTFHPEGLFIEICFDIDKHTALALRDIGQLATVRRLDTESVGGGKMTEGGR